MPVRALLLVLGAALLQSACVLAGGQCSSVPGVSGVDQSPTQPRNWAKCTSATQPEATKWGHWCSKDAKPFAPWPNGPTDKAKQCMKFGRTTIYRGPMYGSSQAQKAACNKQLHGANHAAMVAVSTKYLKTYEGGWNPSAPGACGKCMCIHLHGGDKGWNPGLQPENVKKHMGLTFLGQVGDRCGECPDDSIDILQDRPLTYAPFNPANPDDNTWAPYANAKDGVRGFADPDYMRGAAGCPESVGTWVSDWQWVPCSYTHDKCVDLMKSMGYSDAHAPGMTPGIDSYTMREMGQLRLRGGGQSKATRCPYNNCKIDQE